MLAWIYQPSLLPFSRGLLHNGVDVCLHNEKTLNESKYIRRRRTAATKYTKLFQKNEKPNIKMPVRNHLDNHVLLRVTVNFQCSLFSQFVSFSGIVHATNVTHMFNEKWLCVQIKIQLQTFVSSENHYSNATTATTKMVNNWERKSEILGYRKCEKPQSRTYDKWNENDVNGVVKSSHTLNDLMRKIYGSVNIWQIAMRTTVSVYLNTHRESSEKTFKFNAKWILKMT